MLTGEEVAGPYVRLACERHMRDLRDGPARGLVWSLPDALHAINFFPKMLRLNGGQFEGLPFTLIGYECFIVGSLFGWKRARDGMRRFRTGYVEIGKGNGKSPLAAGVGLYCLTSDGEARAEVYAAATKREQAMILFRDAVAMVDLSPALRQRIVKTPARSDACWNLAYPARASFFRVLASEDKQSGPRPHCFLIDELHEHPNNVVVSMAAAGHKWRRQPLTFEITNSGFDRQSICFQHHEYSVAILQQRQHDDEWFGYVCALDEGEDPLEDPDCWLKANPGLGKIITEDYLRTQVRQALGMPAEQSRVLRLNFCQWTDAENPWIQGELWMRCEQVLGADATAVLRLLATECEEVVGALDLSGTRDLTALTLAGKRISDGHILAYTEFWTPADTLKERSRTDRVEYDLWVEQGHIRTTPGRAVNYKFVAQRLAELTALVPLSRVCFDPYRISFLESDIDDTGTELELIAHPQGGYRSQAKKDKYGRDVPSLWMPRSIELLGNAIGSARIHVHTNPCLRHCSASAVLVPTDDKGNLIFSKRKSRGRIDGIVTLAMVVGLLESADDDGALGELLKQPAIT